MVSSGTIRRTVFPLPPDFIRLFHPELYCLLFFSFCLSGDKNFLPRGEWCDKLVTFRLYSVIELTDGVQL